MFQHILPNMNTLQNYKRIYSHFIKNYWPFRGLSNRNIGYISKIQTTNTNNIRRFIIIVFLILFTSGLLYRTSFYQHLNADINRFSILNGIDRSPHWLIVTSITQLQQYLTSSQTKMSIIFIGNHKHLTLSSNKTNIIFLNCHLQSQLSFRSRNPKVIAYLLAVKLGARFIYEFSSNISFHHQQNIQYLAFRRQRSPFINIHPTFTGNVTNYSPGLPKDELTNITQDGWSSLRTIDSYQETIHPLIQQQILIYHQNKLLAVNHPPVAIEPLTFAPFSSENSLFTYDAFWGLILFESKSDIWRSWWVQRLLGDINGHVVFAASAHQINTSMTSKTDNKNLKEDVNVGKLVRYLSTWKSEKATLIERIEQLIIDMIKQKFCDINEWRVMRAWLDDLKQIQYVFPSIKSVASQQNISGTVRRRRTAVCITGRVECVDEAWRPTADVLRTHVQGEMDVFMYLSSSEPLVDQLSTVPLHLRLIEALRYTNFTVKILFEDIPELDPHFPPNCTAKANIDQPPHKIPRYYQQLFALSNCFSLIHDYEKKHQIKYDLMVRIRGDVTFHRLPSTFDRASPYDINTTLVLPPNRYSSKVDDGFGIGPMDALEVYMNRYYSFQQCLTRDLHPERYLYYYLNYRKVKMIVDQNTLIVPIPHSRKHCH